MNLIYYKSDIGNFGDDLNPWLWEKLLGDFTQYNDDIDFVGVGSILDQRIENNARQKIIFGSGVRDILFTPKSLANWDVKFVRGPISSKILGDDIEFITDSAYCLGLLDEIKNKQAVLKYNLSFIPYFRDYYSFDWKLFEKFTGINVINPTSKVEHVIDEIKSSKQILSAAMHGAIFSDVLRVPWMRVKFSQHGYEDELTSELKWRDWYYSLDMKQIPIHRFDFSFDKSSYKVQNFKRLLMMKYRFSNNQFALSSDKKLTEILERLQIKITEMTLYK